MYAIANEKPLRLVYGTFYLAIFTVFFDFLRLYQGWVAANKLRVYDSPLVMVPPQLGHFFS